MSMILHAGGKEVSRDELDLIPLPQETDSYKPVSHYHLATKLLTISQDLLTDYLLVGEQFALARQGNQMFCVFTFQQKSGRGDLGLSFCARNSYDRSMSLGFACGGSAWICDNLALEGQIVVMKKHTKNVWDSLENDAITTLYKANQSFQKIVEDSGKMKGIALDDRRAAELAGRLYFEEIISPRQLTVVRNEWLKPSFEPYEKRDLWSFYNCCTHAMKTCPPNVAMEKRVQLHNTVIDLDPGQWRVL